MSNHNICQRTAVTSGGVIRRYLAAIRHRADNTILGTWLSRHLSLQWQATGFCVYARENVTNSVSVKVSWKHERTVIRGLHYVIEFLRRTLQIQEGSIGGKKKKTLLSFWSATYSQIFQRRSWLAKCRTVSRYTYKRNLICALRKSTVVRASGVTKPINFKQ